MAPLPKRWVFLHDFWVAPRYEYAYGGGGTGARLGDSQPESKLDLCLSPGRHILRETRVFLVYVVYVE